MYRVALNIKDINIEIETKLSPEQQFLTQISYILFQFICYIINLINLLL